MRRWVILDAYKGQFLVPIYSYRPEKFSFILKAGEEAYLALRERTAQAITQAVADGYNQFMCGMADGFDLVAGSALLELKEKRADMTGIQLIAVLPFAGHGFSSPWQVVHQLVLGRADEVVTLAPKYHHQAYHDRNRYMVDRSGRLICYYDGQKGGTAYTVRYAIKSGLEVINTAELKDGNDPVLRLAT